MVRIFFWKDRWDCQFTKNHLKKKSHEESYLFPVLEVLQFYELEKPESSHGGVFRHQLQVFNMQHLTNNLSLEIVSNSHFT